MKNKIYSYFLKEFLGFFIIILFSLTAIVWTVQSVNFLDLVTEDGHAFSIYFKYSILGVPKIVTKLIPFTFLTAIMLSILKFEKNNELIVLWTSGLNKIKIVNIIFVISIFITILQLVTASSISPTSLNYSRSLLKNSELNFFSSLLKERSFNDTVKSLTVFVEEKNPDGSVKNIFLRSDVTEGESSTTFAKRGYLAKAGDTNYLILYDGITQKEKLNGQIGFINFDKSELNLSQYTSKTTTFPKIQENTTVSLFKCIFWYNRNYSNVIINLLKNNFLLKKINLSTAETCPYKKFDIMNEINRRLGMPLYIPSLALIACYLLSSRRESKRTNALTYTYFSIGFFILVFAEISVRYSGKIFYVTALYYLMPILLIILNYFILYRVFKHENLRI